MSRNKTPLSAYSPKVAAMVAPHSAYAAEEFYWTSPGRITLICSQCGRDRPVSAATAFSRGLADRCNACGIRASYPRKHPTPVQMTHPEFAKRFAKSSAVKPSDVDVTSRKIATFVCPKCRKKYDDTVASVFSRKSRRCPTCKAYNAQVERPTKVSEGQRSLAELFPRVAHFVSPANELAPEQMSVDYNVALLARCDGCGRDRMVRLSRLTDKDWTGRCARCAALNRSVAEAPLAVTHPAVAARFSASSPVKPDAVTHGSSKRAIFVCVYCETDFESIVSNQVRPFASGRCTTCRGSDGRQRNATRKKKRRTTAEVAVA